MSEIPDLNITPRDILRTIYHGTLLTAFGLGWVIVGFSGDERIARFQNLGLALVAVSLGVMIIDHGRWMWLENRKRGKDENF